MRNPYFFCNNLSSISHTNQMRNKAKYLQIVNWQKLACKKAWGGGQCCQLKKEKDKKKEKRHENGFFSLFDFK